MKALTEFSEILWGSRREADAIAGFSPVVIISVGRFSYSPSGMLACILRVLLGLGRMLFALGMVVLAVSFGGSTMRLCRRLVMFRRLIVRVFHFGFSHIGREISAASKSGLNSGQIETFLVLIERTGLYRLNDN